MTITNKEEWLKNMPERILLVLLLKQASEQEQQLSLGKIQDELGGGRSFQDDIILNSIHCLCNNGLIDTITERAAGGLQIVYRLSQKGLAEIGEMVDRARIELIELEVKQRH